MRRTLDGKLLIDEESDLHYVLGVMVKFGAAFDLGQGRWRYEISWEALNDAPIGVDAIWKVEQNCVFDASRDLFKLEINVAPLGLLAP